MLLSLRNLFLNLKDLSLNLPILFKDRELPLTSLLHNNAFNNISSSPYICLAILDLNLYAYIGINKK
ncbi:hypothetical protein RclHR1_20790001 [Rhizophagus clarus]|uniref:Uncharacterized protein n=1 Tax=Rhizophagus clarus TaxID=94130 RepID=A0A2Z6QWH2_9GLOM|nr:hypothetical protein RclHR1_20790001 [Rhizophagus clarus]